MGEAKRRGSFDDRKKNADFKCIICRTLKSSNERSDEHVIPDALNGYYHIFNVCKICNSNMGNSVDNFLINHKLTELYRFSEKISGKSGKIPNPFKETDRLVGDSEVKIRTEISKTGELTHRSFSEPKYETDENNNLKSFSIIVDKKDKKKLPDIQKKLLKRNNLDENNVITSYQEVEVKNPVLSGQWEIDTLKFKLGLLKIAYEFATDSITEYFDDPLAIKISEILRIGNYNEIKNIVITGGFDKNIFFSIDNFIDTNKKRHILFLTSLDQGLICLIKLDTLFQIGIKLSDKKYTNFENSMIGINDLENKSFIKKSFKEFFFDCTGSIYTRLGYYVDSYQTLNSNIYEPKKSDFKYETDKKDLPKIYNKLGNLHKFSFENLLIKTNFELYFKDNLLVEKYSFSENLELYVKSVETNKLYEFRSFEINREFSKI